MRVVSRATDDSLTDLLSTTDKVFAYVDSGASKIGLMLTFGSKPTLDQSPMKLVKNESTPTLKVFEGRLADGMYFRLLVPSSDGLTASTKNLGIKHIVSLYFGSRIRELVGNFYIFEN